MSGEEKHVTPQLLFCCVCVCVCVCARTHAHACEHVCVQNTGINELRRIVGQDHEDTKIL